MKRCLVGALLVLISISADGFGSGRATGMAKLVPDLTKQCAFTVSSNNKEKTKLIDGKHSTSWTSAGANDQFIQVSLPDNADASGIYIMWNTVPGVWSMDGSENTGDWRRIDVGEKARLINAYIPINAGMRRLRIRADGSWKLSVAEISVFGSGKLPASVQVWNAFPGKTDLMVIPAHPDDEFIYFGGTLPYYAGQLNKRTVVVYMTSSPIVRKFEALDGLWMAGVREYPVFLSLANKYTSTVEEAELAWDGLDNTVTLLVEQIRKYKPDVVVTHDLNGEYGHGAHKLTALAVTKAVGICSDPARCPDSADEYGVWQVKKCYLHLYAKGKARMDWRTSLSAFNGKTSLEMAKVCYGLHVSQHFRERAITDSGEYDNSAFGLYRTVVGGDVLHDDFFEHVIAIPSTVPATQPALTATPVPTPGPSLSAQPEEAIETISSNLRRNADGELAIRVFLAFGAIALLTMLMHAYRRSDKKAATAVSLMGSARTRGRS